MTLFLLSLPAPCKEFPVLRHFPKQIFVSIYLRLAIFHPDDLIHLWETDTADGKSEARCCLSPALFRLAKICLSVFLSSAEKGSSRISTGFLWQRVLASASRCACPPERRTPPFPTRVSVPSSISCNFLIQADGLQVSRPHLSVLTHQNVIFHAVVETAPDRGQDIRWFLCAPHPSSRGVLFHHRKCFPHRDIRTENTFPSVDFPQATEPVIPMISPGFRRKGNVIQDLLSVRDKQKIDMSPLCSSPADCFSPEICLLSGSSFCAISGLMRFQETWALCTALKQLRRAGRLHGKLHKTGQKGRETRRYSMHCQPVPSTFF